MKSTRILLHLGLPKTATSSLQHNVLQKLHTEGRINFLGKCLDYDLKTKKLKIHNYTGKFIRDCAEGKLPIKDTRVTLANVLDRKKLNVFSDEGLMIAYPGKDNLPLSEKFRILGEIFEGYDLKIVVTLRDPIDYLYSLYVELYPDYFSYIREINSINKYLSKLLGNPDDLLFESFFYDKWLKILGKKFEVSVISYEKLASGDHGTLASWANLLDITEPEFSTLFNSRKVNVKPKSGKEVQQLKDLRQLEKKLKTIAAKIRPIYYLARWLYNNVGLKKIFHYRFFSKKTHKYPTGSDLERLSEIIGLNARRDDSL